MPRLLRKGGVQPRPQVLLLLLAAMFDAQCVQVGVECPGVEGAACPIAQALKAARSC